MLSVWEHCTTSGAGVSLTAPSRLSRRRWQDLMTVSCLGSACTPEALRFASLNARNDRKTSRQAQDAVIQPLSVFFVQKNKIGRGRRETKRKKRKLSVSEMFSVSALLPSFRPSCDDATFHADLWVLIKALGWILPPSSVFLAVTGARTGTIISGSN